MALKRKKTSHKKAQQIFSGMNVSNSPQMSLWSGHHTNEKQHTAILVDDVIVS